MKAPKRVFISWNDSAHYHTGWETFEELLESPVPIMSSIGFLVGKTEEAVYLVGMVDPDGFGSGLQIIPKKSILKIEEV